MFRWGGTEGIQVLLRRPGAPETSWIEWRCFAVPPSKDRLRRVNFTDDGQVRLIELWLDQQFAREPARPRLGWVYGLVIAAFGESDEPLRPQEVIQRAERLHGHRIAPSSIRNCLRTAAQRADTAVVRHAYGRYGLRL